MSDSKPPISRFPVPAILDLPDDLRARILAVQEKSGFVPNVFLALSHRPDEFRAFFAYHDALTSLRTAFAGKLITGAPERNPLCLP